jgi:serine phosphatase RsbU (regulator of sigma subunit)
LERSLDLIRRQRQNPPDAILEALFAAVSEFSGNGIQDDLTAVIVRVDRLA